MTNLADEVDWLNQRFPNAGVIVLGDFSDPRMLACTRDALDHLIRVTSAKGESPGQAILDLLLSEIQPTS